MKRPTTNRRAKRSRTPSGGQKAAQGRPRGRTSGASAARPRPRHGLVAVVGGAAEVAGATVEGIRRTVRAVASEKVRGALAGTIRRAKAALGEPRRRAQASRRRRRR